MAANDPDEAVLDRLSPRYVARAQAEKDPIVEETNIVRSVIREIDDRYDDYMQRGGRTRRAKGKGEREGRKGRRRGRLHHVGRIATAATPVKTGGAASGFYTGSVIGQEHIAYRIRVHCGFFVLTIHVLVL
ncbi:hypothetical protein FE783_35840 [Paenibacillus mesophilus]|uniref:hypothetical protein n=1 Tax=Paenibacillus mesophilus TaxID=2582849 RepID=UPI00110D6900|nr:hypothetical protein [Paenibacillus mesophilus]TMV43192.1 hypothetical protein FE783_35840 [Paenibacillus mesophilus]